MRNGLAENNDAEQMASNKDVESTHVLSSRTIPETN